MLKNLPFNSTLLLTDFIQEYWTNPEMDYESWHKTKLSNLYKGKRDPQDPNNWWDICLKETSSVKIVSIIIVKRLLKQLKKVGITSQFGHIGCQEALHSIRWSLLLRRQHGLPSYVLFIDLVKAFNTIQHELLFQILSKYSIPKELINIMKKMLQGKAHHLRNKLWNWHPTRWQHGSATLPLCNASHHGNPWAFQHHKNQIMILS